MKGVKKVKSDIFKKKLSIVDKQLIHKLEEIQVSLSHNGNRGSSAEAVMREFLKVYLPSSNMIGEGEIVDTNGNTTTQLDIIIANDNQPYINDLREPGLFIIEGVDCVGEIKTNLNSNDIATLIESCIRFKALTSDFVGGMSCFNKSDEERFVKRKPYFIFAYKSQMKIETMCKKLLDHYEENNVPFENQIDAVFTLDRGSIINFGDGKGSFKFLEFGTKNSLTGLRIVKNKDEGILLDLMTWMSSVIHKVIYYQPPIGKYLR